MKAKDYKIQVTSTKVDVKLIKKALIKYKENLTNVNAAEEARDRLTVNRLLEEIDSII